MLLAPGPIPQITVAITPPPPYNAGFTDLVTADTAGLDAIEAGMDGLLDAAAIVDLAPPDDGLGAILDDTEAGLATFSAFDAAGAADQLDQSQANGVNSILNVFETIPGEAWQPVPAPHNYGSGTPGTSNLFALNIDIANLTRPGFDNFYPGDHYEITARVSASVTGAGFQAGSEVFLNAVQDGVLVPFVDLGTTNQYGMVQCQGIIQDDNVGAWNVEGYATDASGNTYLGNTLQFNVNPLPAGLVSGIPPGEVINTPGLFPVCSSGGPAQGIAPTVDLINTTTPGSKSFNLGDTWTLYVNGAPNQDVLIWATLNGVALPKIVLGVTDATGAFVLDGAFDDPIYEGVWQEYYQVGTAVVAVTIFYTVSPGTPSPTTVIGAPTSPNSPGTSSTGTGTTPGTNAPTTGTPAPTAPGLGPGGIFGP
jgi:hypothetical protein